MTLRKRTLNSPEADHIQAATLHVHKAWTELERMPPTCEGGIIIAARAWGHAERAHAELDAVNDRATREQYTELYGLANRAGSAAWETIQFYAQRCNAPFSQTDRVPLFSRAKIKRSRAKTKR